MKMEVCCGEFVDGGYGGGVWYGIVLSGVGKIVCGKNSLKGFD